MPFKQYTPPHDREMMEGSKYGMSGTANSPGPGQMESGSDEYNEDAAPAPPEKEAASGETAMIPIALLGGKEFKPGEEVVMKVVKIDKDNGTVEIAYATGDEGGKGGEIGGMGDEESPAVKRMDSMMGNY